MLSDSLKEFIKTTPDSAGVYQFIGKNQQILYIGKAKNLRNRLASYCNENSLAARINIMTSLAKKIDFIVCDSEEKALILECNLIKQKQPKFNILLRDDKSFPFILINTENDFAKIEKHRGIKKSKGYYFGPFATTQYLDSAIDLIKKTFLLRDCADYEFNRRKSPCLEYQIKRCSAPCVGKISTEDYQKNANNALNFFRGKHGQLQQELAVTMQKYGENMEYEKALILREKIKALCYIQTKFTINKKWAQSADIIFIENIGELFCISFSFYRLGYDYGTKFYFFDSVDKFRLDEIILQFYLKQELPQNIFLNYDLEDKVLLQNALYNKKQKKVKFEFFNLRDEEKSSLSKGIIKQKQQQITINLEKKYQTNHKNIKILSNFI
jgi:excinuclease ABC subunit C